MPVFVELEVMADGRQLLVKPLSPAVEKFSIDVVHSDTLSEYLRALGNSLARAGIERLSSWTESVVFGYHAGLGGDIKIRVPYVVPALLYSWFVSVIADDVLDVENREGWDYVAREEMTRLVSIGEAVPVYPGDDSEEGVVIDEALMWQFIREIVLGEELLNE